MSFYIMLLIMIVTGLLGGGINYILQNYRDEKDKTIPNPPGQCLVLGIGATLLVPLFLKIADSKLMDDINFRIRYADDISKQRQSKSPDTLVIKITKDSADSKAYKADTTTRKAKAETKGKMPKSNDETGKNYFLWMSYCLLAASAGFKFINMLINNFVKDEKLKEITHQNNKLKKEAKVQKLVRSKDAEKAELEAKEILIKNKMNNIVKTKSDQIEIPVIFQLPPIRNTDDPQKGRFRGLPERNHRKLMATVEPTDDPVFYKVNMWVESSDPDNHPLTGIVVFYLHDTFRPSVITVPVKEGKAMYDEEAYGAFTIGALADDGQTPLELDLASDKTFPAHFRKR